ncbi:MULTISPECIES: hypothetical protein [Brevibacillus]|nr:MULTISPECIES: hypothetical protein [Brevibacillus]MBU8713721.1 hypothetical protein [Brevibacillus parabrevis]MED2256217.1 hypothetical protein [Brevibacillus parabrevis]NRQ53526.1 hypothetical protein [Brevibacillus sp. HD1.4A]UED68622.1 hypothetical protein HP435_25860 [Brevibacillus sp. HD3.3A]WDV94912.1 hypothetical protein PSE45_25305 [Brevibacillus parabrevis]
MKKVLSTVCKFFGGLSNLNSSGALKAAIFHEPLPPHMREEEKSKVQA